VVTSSAAGEGVVLPPGVSPLEIGDPAEIGDHRLVGRLGSGGMGVVYLAHDADGALAAVKAAHHDDEEVRLRFQAEAACARRLPPGCTARLLVDGTAETPPYIISEYVEGRPLEDVIDTDGPLPPEQLRALAVGVARALAAVHAAELIHRDLKPGNVLLTPTGPRVIDFGIAQRVPASGGLTGTGIVMGSAGWIAPERLTRNPATPAADIFGWGCLIAYAGTGRNPFGPGDADEIARRTIKEPPDLDGLDPGLRLEVEAALAKNPLDRPHARELLTWLEHGTRVPRAARRANASPLAVRAPEKPRRRKRVRRWQMLAAGAVMVVVATAFAVPALLGTDRTPSRRPGSDLIVPPDQPGTRTHRAGAPPGSAPWRSSPASSPPGSSPDGKSARPGSSPRPTPSASSPSPAPSPSPGNTHGKKKGKKKGKHEPSVTPGNTAHTP
jgi:serine/threonine protein kinase